MAGWGRYTSQIMSSTLRKLDVEVFSENACTKFTKADTKNFICTGDPKKKNEFAYIVSNFI